MEIEELYGLPVFILLKENCIRNQRYTNAVKQLLLDIFNLIVTLINFVLSHGIT